MIELRHHPRAHTLLRAVIARGDRVFESVTTDLGIGGLFLLGETPLREGEVVSVDVDLGEGRGFCALARVARRQHPAPRGLDVPGFGLEFVEISPAAAAIVREITATISQQLSAHSRKRNAA